MIRKDRSSLLWGRDQAAVGDVFVGGWLPSQLKKRAQRFSRAASTGFAGRWAVAVALCTVCAALASLGRAAAATTSIDFDGFSVGTNNAAAQVGGRLTTWLNDPGGSEDGNVVANPAAGGTGNALFVETSDDVVLSLGASESVQGGAWGEVTATSSGTVNLAFDLYVPSGNYALWSVIKRDVHNARVDAVWLQYGAVNFTPGGENSGRISYGWGNGESYVTPSPALLYDQWVHVEQTLYVGIDTYALKINGTEAVSGITDEFLPGGNQGFGYESGLLGVEFEGTGSDGTYYVDNITFNLASAAPVPEPASVTLLALGLAGIAICQVRGGTCKRRAVMVRGWTVGLIAVVWGLFPVRADAELVHRWTFEDGTQDVVGSANGTLFGDAYV